MEECIQMTQQRAHWLYIPQIEKVVPHNYFIRHTLIECDWDRTEAFMNDPVCQAVRNNDFWGVTTRGQKPTLEQCRDFIAGNCSKVLAISKVPAISKAGGTSADIVYTLDMNTTTSSGTEDHRHIYANLNLMY